MAAGYAVTAIYTVTNLTSGGLDFDGTVVPPYGTANVSNISLDLVDAVALGDISIVSNVTGCFTNLTRSTLGVSLLSSYSTGATALVNYAAAGGQENFLILGNKVIALENQVKVLMGLLNIGGNAENPPGPPTPPETPAPFGPMPADVAQAARAAAKRIAMINFIILILQK
jgi:hypothetical protein